MGTKQDFKYASATCGFKKTNKPDLAIIYSPLPCAYAGVFTTNQIHAACIDINKELLKKRKKIRAIIVNSGNANACTGKKGINAAKETQRITAKFLKIKPDEVLVASTGGIGIQLDMEKMRAGLGKALPNLSSKNINAAAKAILTTDRYIKLIKRKTKHFSLTGFTKGAGMIHPNMATMLCYLMTDLNVSQELLQHALRTATDKSFNNISVDGDMSTNDMVILISNRQSKKEINSKNDPVFISFQEILTESCIKLAKEIVLDGEGANKLINVLVNGAKSTADAKEIARSISSSVLFKCAIYGSDPNWGRAAARIGCTSVKIDSKKVDLYLNKTLVYKKGASVEFNKEKLNKEIKKGREVKVTVNLNLGNKSASAYGCDLSYEYVKFNSAYFT